jgi:hypothetical protein
MSHQAQTRSAPRRSCGADRSGVGIRQVAVRGLLTGLLVGITVAAAFLPVGRWGGESAHGSGPLRGGRGSALAGAPTPNVRRG